jgi:hypothetical protein
MKEKTMRLFLVFTLVVYVSSCSPNQTQDADSGLLDAGNVDYGQEDSGSPANPEQIITACETALVEQCYDEIYQIPLQLSASEFGEGVTFIDVMNENSHARGAILAEQEINGQVEVILIWFHDWEVVGEIESIAKGSRDEIRAVSLVSNEDLQPDPLALLCRGKGNDDCYVHEIISQESGYIPEDKPPFPAMARPSGMGSTFRIFGNGIWNWDHDRWKRELLLNEEDTINAMYWGETAVGDNGKWWAKEDSGWVAYDTGIAADFMAVFNDTASTEDGKIVRLGTENPTVIEVATEAIPVFQENTAWTKSGCLMWFSSEDTMCVYSTIPGRPLAILKWQCNSTPETAYFTSDGIFGDWGCLFIY